jgi:hypothetical protein
MLSEPEALDRLRGILARPEFQSVETRTWWDQLGNAVLDLLFNFFAQIVQAIQDAASGREGGVGLIALGLALVIVAGVVLYLLRSIRLAVVRETRLAAESRTARRERSDRLWASAQRMAAASDWAGAVRAAYLSALYALDEHALLHVQSGLTNREHAAQLAHLHPELGNTFAELVLRYDRLRYGRYPITAEAFTDLSQLVSQARSSAPA